MDLRIVIGWSSSESLVKVESLTRSGIGGTGCEGSPVVRMSPGSFLRRYPSLKEFHVGFETSGVSRFIKQDNVGVCTAKQCVQVGEA